ncbi:hypothetical protein AKJ53_00765 [candidate division MSBL1 archaeon SCGC-AAA382F02]|uniref:Cas12f1-like TNB domain-containing protein n=1 Tax=candidate division MSBL1 archaeon SCGC-AAA382F02 TaxID=1698282 RepID=A0A133VIN3_9EURY|nr:hypothetical protein AKJ53_00765 [candidate division MSBL1 archaeon SCGC-AAA382F02]
MKSTVTAKVKIRKDERLVKTMRVYSKALQFCIDRAWNNLYTRKSIHDECYYKIREKFGLQAQLAVCVISQTHEMLKNSPKNKPKVKKFATIRYNFSRSATIKGEWEKLSLASTDGRVKVELNIPGCYEEYLDRNVRESNLILKNDMLFFCFTFTKEVDINPFSFCDGGKIRGVDLGINKIAVTSDENFYGTNAKEKRIKWEELRAELQRKGTHASHKRIKSMGKRFNRYMTWMNHNISKKIIDKLDEGDVLVMEDLTNIRKTAKYNEWVHKWAFRQLQNFLEYKAVEKGIRVVYVNPENTSKKCSKCGSLDTERHGGFFECNNCGFSLDADLNASRNIAHSYTETIGRAGSRRSAYGSRVYEVETFNTGRIETETTRKLHASF